MQFEKSALSSSAPIVPWRTGPRPVDAMVPLVVRSSSLPNTTEPSTMYQHLGAHLLPEKNATRFAVWAPNAAEVCVINDRNGWQHGAFHLFGSDSGIWSGEVPEVGAGDKYKFSIKTHDGHLVEKADPYAFATELRPKTASIVYDLNQLEWTDDEWMASRAERD